MVRLVSDHWSPFRARLILQQHHIEEANYLGMKEDIDRVCDDWRPWLEEHPINDHN
jgi:hypothetical protein